MLISGTTGLYIAQVLYRLRQCSDIEENSRALQQVTRQVMGFFSITWEYTWILGLSAGLGATAESMCR